MVSAAEIIAGQEGAGQPETRLHSTMLLHARAFQDHAPQPSREEQPADWSTVHTDQHGSEQLRLNREQKKRQKKVHRFSRMSRSRSRSLCACSSASSCSALLRQCMVQRVVMRGNTIYLLLRARATCHTHAPHAAGQGWWRWLACHRYPPYQTADTVTTSTLSQAALGGSSPTFALTADTCTCWGEGMPTDEALPPIC